MNVGGTIHKQSEYLKRFFWVDEHLRAAPLFAAERRRWNHARSQLNMGQFHPFDKGKLRHVRHSCGHFGSET